MEVLYASENSTHREKRKVQKLAGNMENERTCVQFGKPNLSLWFQLNSGPKTNSKGNDLSIRASRFLSASAPGVRHPGRGIQRTSSSKHRCIRSDAQFEALNSIVGSTVPSFLLCGQAKGCESDSSATVAGTTAYRRAWRVRDGVSSTALRSQADLDSYEMFLIFSVILVLSCDSQHDVQDDDTWNRSVNISVSESTVGMHAP